MTNLISRARDTQTTLQLQGKSLYGLIRASKKIERNISNQKKELISLNEQILKTKKLVNDLATRERQRILDTKKFVKDLKGKPKGVVKLLYSPNDSEAYMFAVQIYRWLGPGVNGDGAGWKVSSPLPIPSNGEYTYNKDLTNAPLAMKYGAWWGLGISTSELLDGHYPYWQDKSAIGALERAFLDNGYTPICHFGVKSLPRNVILLVVGQKQQN